MFYDTDFTKTVGRRTFKAKYIETINGNKLSKR